MVLTCCDHSSRSFKSALKTFHLLDLSEIDHRLVPCNHGYTSSPHTTIYYVVVHEMDSKNDGCQEYQKQNPDR
jgi:hypothetical protein